MTQPDGPGAQQATTGAGPERGRRLPGLRRYLLAFTLALLLPALGIGGLVAWQAIHIYREAFEARLQDTARALALAVDREIGGYEATLSGLAASRSLDEDATEADFADFHRRAQAVSAALGSWVVVQGPGPDYATQLHTLVPPGQLQGQSLGGGLRLPESDAPLPRVFRTGQPALGSLARGPRSGRLVSFIFAPVLREGRVIRAIGMALDPGRFSRLLARQELGRSAFAVLVDGQGVVFARSRDHEDYVGRPAPGWYLAGLAQRGSGFMAGQALEGQPVVLGFARLSSAPGWSIAVSEAAATYEASWRRPLELLAAAGGLAVLLGVGLAFWMGGRLLRPVRALTADAAAVVGAAVAEAGAPPRSVSTARQVPMAVAEFETLRRHLGAADATLRQQAAEARAGEARLRAAQAAGRVGGFEYDVAQGRLWRSEEQQRMHGIDPEGPQPDIAAYLARVHPQDRPDLSRRIHAALTQEEGGSEVHATFRFFRFDTGAERWLALDARVTARDPAGHALVFSGTTRDITEHQRAVRALAASEERLRLAIEGTGMGSWDLDVSSGRLIFSRHVFLMLGRPPPPGGETTLEAWRAHVHPDDLPNLLGAWRHAEQEDGLYSVTYRIRRVDDGSERWLESYGRFLRGGGETGPRFVGVMFDVTARRLNEQRQELLMREVDHRAKNALAVVLSVVRLSRAEDPRAFVEVVEGRVGALARAHELLARDKWRGAELRALAGEELAAYEGTAGAGRVSLEGPPLRLLPEAVQPLSMALHELATNAARHGALSRPEGRVTLRWEVAPAEGAKGLLLHWAEQGGPPVDGPPARQGFGSRLLQVAVEGQLAGAVETDWNPAGLRCAIRVPGRFLLPGAEEAGPAGSLAPRPPAGLPLQALHGVRVLLVEDEALIAEDTAQILAGLGCTVLGPAATLEAALDYANGLEKPPDVALLDINLGGLASFPVAERLKRREVPVVFVTGYGSVGAWQAMASAVLRKPVSPAELAATLQRVLGRLPG